MATMIPPELPDRKDSDIPESERDIFDALKTGPGTKGWIVLHSVKVPGKRRNSYPREADFLIMKPGAGAMCLEVKGDAYDVSNGQWYRQSAGPDAGPEPQAPHEQAETTMDAVKAFLLKQARAPQQQFRQRIARMPIWYAVAFTTAGWPEGIELPDCDVYDSPITRDPSLLCSKLAKSLGDLPGRRNSNIPLTSDTISFIQQTLKPNFSMENHAWTIKFNRSLQEIVELTEKQADVLRLARSNSRLMVQGGAGTGKTMLALKLAQERAREGDRVALLCHHPKLARLLAGEMRTFGNAVVYDRGGLSRWLLEESPHSKDINRLRQSEQDWSRFMNAGQHLDAMGTVALHALRATHGKPPQFDYIVIDEFQWFGEITFFDVLDQILDNGLSRGRWTIFADFANQSTAIITATASGHHPVDPVEALEMTTDHWTNDELVENCRNTGNIFRCMQGFDASETPYRMKPGITDGTPVRVHSYDNMATLFDILDAEIHRLHDNGIRRDQIVVLNMTQGLSDPKNRSFGPEQWPLVFVAQDKIIADHGLTMSHAPAFGGLESDIIICIVGAYHQAIRDASGGQEWFRSMLYTGLSRPKAELIILCDEDLPDEFKDKVGISRTDSGI